jgi:hypothetical protein
MENFKVVTPVVADTTSLPDHKAFMLCATASNGSAVLDFYGKSTGITGANDVTVRLLAHTTLILPVRVKATGTLTACTCYMLD